MSTVIVTLIYSCQDAEQLEYQTYYSNGQTLYQTYCQNCHGEKGEGLGLLTPPLTDSLFLKNNRTVLACIIKNGATTPVTVHGKTYEEKMPAFPKLADIDIAQIIVYVTNSFGNKMGMYPYADINKDLKSCATR
ncbi:MAG: cytochrome c [Pedobacter sp.]|nr:cytochrome c [Pedobacter sp.]MDQ8051631.1 cytochrome c [Pedobacter sp.]